MEQVPAAGLCWRVQGYDVSRKVDGFRNLPGGLAIHSGSTLVQTGIG